LKIVMKFGGTSLADGDRMKHVAEIVSKYYKMGHKIVVVTSAAAGVTDDLQTAVERASSGDRGYVDGFIKKLAQRHEDTASAILDQKSKEVYMVELNERLNEIKNVLLGMTYLREATPRSKDFIMSMGERLSSPLFCLRLQKMGLDAKFLNGWEAGIITDDRYGEAKPLMPLVLQLVRERLGPLIEKGIIAVVTGYIATTSDGHITTLGRGGSDYTASILGSALSVDEIWIWTDVDGIMTTDPRIEPSAKVIPELSFGEAAEMALFGAKLHPKTLEPAVAQGIPIRVRNTFNPDNVGSLILNKEIVGQEIVKAVTMSKNMSLINVNISKDVGVANALSNLFKALLESKIDTVMTSQSSSEPNVSLVVQRKDVDISCKAIRGAFEKLGFQHQITADNDICVVAAVGAGMKGKLGTAARIFSAVAREGINVIMITQGSSELNISFVTKKADGERAVRAIHREFMLGGDKNV